MVFKDRLEVIEATEVVDRYGNITYDWENPTVVQVVSAHVDYSSTSVLDTNNRFQVESKLTAYCRPFGYDYETQRLRWRGTHYEPDGDQLDRSIGGRAHHVEIPLRQVLG